MKLSFFILIFLVLVSACTKELKYDKTQMYKMGTKVEPTLELILPKDINSGIKCSDYGKGCLSGVTAKVRLVEIILVEFDTEENARNEALKLDQYYTRNWLLDDVRGEPLIESFVKQAFNAKKASK